MDRVVLAAQPAALQRAERGSVGVRVPAVLQRAERGLGGSPSTGGRCCNGRSGDSVGVRVPAVLQRAERGLGGSPSTGGVAASGAGIGGSPSTGGAATGGELARWSFAEASGTVCEAPLRGNIGAIQGASRTTGVLSGAIEVDSCSGVSEPFVGAIDEVARYSRVLDA